MPLPSIPSNVTNTKRRIRLDLPSVRTSIAIRLAFLVGTALTLLWWPTPAPETFYGAYDARSDLLFGVFERGDAGWFLRIADHGYDIPATTPFFPLYPLLVRGLGTVLFSNLVAGVLLSLVAATVAVVVIERITAERVGPAAARDTVLYVSLYPLAFVFTAVYSEGLFLALSAGAFLAALRGRSWLAGVLAALAVATRLAGLALLPALLYLLWPRGRGTREVLRPLPLLLVPGAVGAYLLYLEQRFGDWHVFTNASEEHWLRHFQTLGPLGGLWEALSAGAHGAAELLLHLPPGLGGETGFPHRDQLAVWNVVHALVLVAALWLTWVAWRRLGPAFGLYALAANAIPLSSLVDTFPLQSFPRYPLVNFPLFMALAVLLAGRPRARQSVLVGFAAVGAVAAVAFARGVWIA